MDQIRSSVHRQIRALRATMAAVIGQLDALEAALGQMPCQHPEDERKTLATFDQPKRWQCGRCGHIDEGGED